MKFSIRDRQPDPNNLADLTRAVQKDWDNLDQQILTQLIAVQQGMSGGDLGDYWPPYWPYLIQQSHYVWFLHRLMVQLIK